MATSRVVTAVAARAAMAAARVATVARYEFGTLRKHLFGTSKALVRYFQNTTSILRKHFPPKHALTVFVFIFFPLRAATVASSRGGNSAHACVRRGGRSLA